MTPRELEAYRAGLRYSADMALISAMTLELRDDAGKVRQRAAIEALRGLAEGLKAEARSANGLTPIIQAVGVPSDGHENND